MTVDAMICSIPQYHRTWARAKGCIVQLRRQVAPAKVKVYLMRDTITDNAMLFP
jgi:hypothetical protein